LPRGLDFWSGQTIVKAALARTLEEIPTMLEDMV
jgi:hypothetical protein